MASLNSSSDSLSDALQNASINNIISSGTEEQEWTYENFCIDKLPNDLLYLIFQYLNPSQLCCVSCVNRRFNQIASKNTLWFKHAKKQAVILPDSDLFYRNCSAKELYQIAPNWVRGRRKERFCMKSRKK